MANASSDMADLADLLLESDAGKRPVGEGNHVRGPDLKVQRKEKENLLPVQSFSLPQHAGSSTSDLHNIIEKQQAMITQMIELNAGTQQAIHALIANQQVQPQQVHVEAAVSAAGQAAHAASTAAASAAAAAGSLVGANTKPGGEKIPASITKAWESAAQKLEKDITKYKKAVHRVKKLREDVATFAQGEKSKDIYPAGVRPFRSPADQEELDQIWSKVVQHPYAWEIKIPQGCSRRDAMRIVHWSAAYFLKGMDLEAQEGAMAALKTKTSINCLEQACAKVAEECLDLSHARELGLDIQLQKPIDPEIVENTVGKLYKKAITKVEKKEKEREELQEKEKKLLQKREEDLVATDPEKLFEHAVASVVNRCSKDSDSAMNVDDDSGAAAAAVNGKPTPSGSSSSSSTTLNPCSAFVTAVTKPKNGKSPEAAPGHNSKKGKDNSKKGKGKGKSHVSGKSAGKSKAQSKGPQQKGTKAGKGQKNWQGATSGGWHSGKGSKPKGKTSQW